MFDDPDRDDPDRDDPDRDDPQAEPPVRSSGSDLVRAALEQAKAAARERGVAPHARRRTRAGRRPAQSSAGGSDPELFGAAVARLITERGWDPTVRSAAVTGRWDTLVGPELAAHCRPESLREGELVVQAESTAWATQLRLLNKTMLARLRAELGPDVIDHIVVHGPIAPSWRKGPLRVVGRGPRDTYG